MFEVSRCGIAVVVALAAVACGGHIDIGTDTVDGVVSGGGSAGKPPIGTGGFAGKPAGNPGGGGAPPIGSCPAQLDFEDGTLGDLEFGHNNNKFVNLTNSSDVVKSYLDDTIFDSHTLRMTGAFEPTANPPAQTLGPEHGLMLAPWLGEVEVLSKRCRPADLTGRTVAVTFFAPLQGAIVEMPPSGAFLGSYSGGMTYYADATVKDIVNTTTSLKLTHTFTADEAERVSDYGLYLRVYVLGYATVKLHIDKIEWR